jgi:hypothetical protein
MWKKWCGDSSFTESGYDVLVGNFSKTNVPVFFSEFGCNTPAPRVFTEIPVLYGPLVTPSLSGGIVYEYVQAENKFGLVVLNDDGSAKLLPDFDTLQAQYNKLDFKTLEGTKSTNTTVAPPDCKSVKFLSSTFSRNFTAPAIIPGIASLITNGIKNPNQGKIISISDYNVKQVVKSSSGTVMTGLKVTPLPDDESNAPSGANDTSPTSNPTSSTTSPAPAATTSKKGAAGRVEAAIMTVLGAAFLAALLS